LLEKLGSKIGPGYHYFRIANRLLELESKEWLHVIAYKKVIT
jgi:hypothetical protein